MIIEKHIIEIIDQGKINENLFYLPDHQLDRKTYLAVNKVLEYLGGKWNRKLKAHTFESDLSDRISDVLLTGEVIDKKKEFQFFETPKNVVNQLIELAEVRIGNKCLEPSAGRGNIAEALAERAGIGKVTCVELNPENAAVLAKKRFYTVTVDFLNYRALTYFDRIVMNPPFTRQQDVAHVLKALSFLADNGILVSAMSARITFRQDKKTSDFWDKVKEYDFSIIDLPQGSFKVSGTMVNTVILKIVTER